MDSYESFGRGSFSFHHFAAGCFSPVLGFTTLLSGEAQHWKTGTSLEENGAGDHPHCEPSRWRAVRTDSGIVFLKNRPFVICVMTTFLKDARADEDAISRVAALAYSTFKRLARSSPYRRPISPK